MTLSSMSCTCVRAITTSILRFVSFFDDSMASSEGPSWREQKRLLQPAFSPASLLQMSPVVVSAAQRYLDGRAASYGEAIEIFSDMRRLVLSIAGRLLMGVDLTGQAADIVVEAVFAAFGYGRFQP